MNILEEILYLLMYLLSRLLGYIPCFKKWFESEPELNFGLRGLDKSEIKRFIISDKRFIVSPASGTITNISEYMGYIRIYIFVGLFDSHVQYYPYSGRITKVKYSKGKPLQILGFNIQYPAYTVKSANNEMSTTYLYNEKTGEIIITQIAGILANRIINNSEVGQEVNQGDKLGKIIMGSSVILYIPKRNISEILVKKGDTIQPLQPLIQITSRNNSEIKYFFNF